MTQSGPTSFNPLAVAQQSLDTPLSRILADRIQREGPMTFAEWMDQCLYHPEHGYYRSGRTTIGRDGDFLTSPEVHPLFGAAIAHLATELWRRGDGGEFHVAEIGPGTGALAESFLRQIHTTSTELAKSLRYTLVERDQQTGSQQLERLRSFHGIHSINKLVGEQQLILANELLDALPVHRLQFTDDRWRELQVDFSAAAGFHDALCDVSNLELLAPLSQLAPADEQIVEIGLGRADAVSVLADAVAEGGLLLLFDYGYARDRLYASWRRDGTLMTFRNHVSGDDPYLHPGEQDITAHIDIDQVTQSAVDAGLTPLPALSQAEWLHNLGAAVLPAVADADTDTTAYLAARRAAETLTDPAGLGRIAVMGFTRGPTGPLPGWTTQ
ncbi:MAG: SAM-dependent methyltransferase [Chloroflexi bacterium]|nr:SAM-dependent methyltransferase [Chloroflexota bacterium]